MLTGKSKLLGANADLARDFRRVNPAGFYLLGGVGTYHVKPEVSGLSSPSETRFAWNGGAGGRLDVGATRRFLKSRYVSGSTSGGKTSFIPVTAGVSFVVR